MKKLNWAIVGTGWIAGEMAEALNKLNGEIYAVCATSKQKTENFSKKYNIDQCYDQVENMLADDKIDIVYIATPHNLHYELILKSLQAKKHVFCEKAITINDQQLKEVIELAKKQKRIVFDGITIFHMPLFKQIKQSIQDGIIGETKMIQINFGSCKEYDIKNRFFSKELAGGALLDIGVYAVSFARYFMSSKPIEILTTANFFETGVDETSGIILKNKENEMAVISLTMRAKQPKRAIIAGTLGYIEVNNYPRSDKATIFYTDTGKSEDINVGVTDNALEYEIADMQDYVLNNDIENILEYSMDIMEILTKIRNQWKMTYPFE